jgi:hypothetical protein
MGEEVSMMSRTLESVATYTNACSHRSLRSTGLRLAVVIHKLSNVKLDTSVASGSDDEALQCNVRRSLDADAPAYAYLVGNLGRGGHPQVGGGSRIYDPPLANARNKNTLVVLD